MSESDNFSIDRTVYKRGIPGYTSYRVKSLNNTFVKRERMSCMNSQELGKRIKEAIEIFKNQ